MNQDVAKFEFGLEGWQELVRCWVKGEQPSVASRARLGMMFWQLMLDNPRGSLWCSPINSPEFRNDSKLTPITYAELQELAGLAGVPWDVALTRTVSHLLDEAIRKQRPGDPNAPRIREAQASKRNWDQLLVEFNAELEDHPDLTETEFARQLKMKPDTVLKGLNRARKRADKRSATRRTPK